VVSERVSGREEEKGREKEREVEILIKSGPRMIALQSIASKHTLT